MKTTFRVFFITLLVLVTNITQAQKGLIADKAMVVSAREEASKIGVAIMKKGGNAFDAMVATELALAVAYPYAGNIGGGGFMVYRKANGETGTLDYREKAPLSATKNMFLDKAGNILPDKSTDSPLAIGVPGTIAGVFAVHKKLGSLPMSEIMKPVIELAEKGVIVTKKQEKSLNNYREAIIKANGNTTKFATIFKENDTIKYPALAETLKRIAKNAGINGPVVVEKVQQNEFEIGYNAAKNVFGNMYEEGIVDPAKVTRSGLQNATSIASMILTTECIIVDEINS